MVSMSPISGNDISSSPDSINITGSGGIVIGGCADTKFQFSRGGKGTVGRKKKRYQEQIYATHYKYLGGSVESALYFAGVAKNLFVPGKANVRIASSAAISFVPAAPTIIPTPTALTTYDFLRSLNHINEQQVERDVEITDTTESYLDFLKSLDGYTQFKPIVEEIKTNIFGYNAFGSLGISGKSLIAYKDFSHLLRKIDEEILLSEGLDPSHEQQINQQDVLRERQLIEDTLLILLDSSRYDEIPVLIEMVSSSFQNKPRSLREIEDSIINLL